ncbi:MAG TPA: porin, partial [Rhodocyclaceae bacterium]|nr:porin [Rhodocyclaceae bacterium]
MDKQQLLAAALAVTAFAAPQFAQAQEKIVSFYGLLDVNLAHEKAGKLSRTGLDHSELNGTRFGVKGSTPLAGTMKAVYVLEGG